MNVAAMPPEAAFGGAPTNATLRSPGKCFLLLLASFGLWGFAWINDTLKDIEKATGKDTQAALRTVLYIIPIVNIYSLYVTWKDVNEFVESSGIQGFNVVLFVVFSFIPFLNIYAFITVQSKLNEAWGKRSGGIATDAPLSQLGKVLVIIGALFWAFYILIFVVVGVLAS